MHDLIEVFYYVTKEVALSAQGIMDYHYNWYLL